MLFIFKRIKVFQRFQIFIIFRKCCHIHQTVCQALQVFPDRSQSSDYSIWWHHNEGIPTEAAVRQVPSFPESCKKGEQRFVSSLKSSWSCSWMCRCRFGVPAAAVPTRATPDRSLEPLWKVHLINCTCLVWPCQCTCEATVNIIEAPELNCTKEHSLLFNHQVTAVTALWLVDSSDAPEWCDRFVFKHTGWRAHRQAHSAAVWVRRKWVVSLTSPPSLSAIFCPQIETCTLYKLEHRAMRMVCGGHMHEGHHRDLDPTGQKNGYI